MEEKRRYYLLLLFETQTEFLVNTSSLILHRDGDDIASTVNNAVQDFLQYNDSKNPIASPRSWHKYLCFGRDFSQVIDTTRMSAFYTACLPEVISNLWR